MLVGVVLRIAGLGLQSAADHRAEVTVDDVEMGVEVHLHLPELMVADHDNGVVPESVGFQHLADALVVSTHAAANQGDIACWDVL